MSGTIMSCSFSISSRKLRLRDEIEKLHDMIVPDIIA